MEEQNFSSVIVLTKEILPNDAEKSNLTLYENVDQTNPAKEPLVFSPMFQGSNIVAWNLVPPQN